MGLVEDLSDLDAEGQEALGKALADAAFTIAVTGIDSIVTDIELRVWKVRTEAGPRSFETRLGSWPRKLEGGGVLIQDVAEDLYHIRDTAALDEALEELSKKVKEVSETEQKVVDAIKTKIDGDQQACLNALSNIQQGVTCYLASAFADKNTSVESTKIVVTVSRDKVGAELDKCMDFYDAACLVGTGTALSGDVTVSDDSFTTKKEKWGEFCEDLKAVFGDADKKETRYELLINNFKPYDFDFFPTKSLFDTAKDTLSDFAGDVKDFFSLKARLLLGEDDVELKASASSGEDVVSFGTESGVDKPKVGSSSILSIIAITMIGMLIK